jgi:ketosteroid isomerase-like protein
MEIPVLPNKLSNMTDTKQLREKTIEWITAWNSGDFKSLMDHYADDVVFYSPAAARRWNITSGKLTGKKALENHFRKAFEEIPGMKLDFRYLLTGTDGVLLVYQRETGKIAADLVLFNEEGKAKEIRVFNED